MVKRMILPLMESAAAGLMAVNGLALIPCGSWLRALACLTAAAFGLLAAWTGLSAGEKLSPESGAGRTDRTDAGR